MPRKRATTEENGRSLRLHLAFHHHQPVGNFPDVLEECCQLCYLPLLEAVEKRPSVKVNLSYSGPILEYLAERHPDYLRRLRELIAAGRAELLATGFYEPILAELDEEDRQGQLGLSREWLLENVGVAPRGVWLAEGVWSQEMIPSLRAAGFDFTVIGRERFLLAGVPPVLLQGHLLTEHLGEVFHLFPNDDPLRQIMPYGGIPELTNYLRRTANRAGVTALTFADAAERWGVWPGSHARVVASGYLESLMDFLQEQSGWLRTGFFNDHLESHAPAGRCYIPPGVSKELGAWSLPDAARGAFLDARRSLEQRFDSQQFLPYFRAGSWAGFKARYDEANWMEKKQLRLKRLAAARGHCSDPALRSHLWAAQCNTAYWHGSSGGIYFPHLREAVWRHLLEAESLLTGGEKNGEWRVEEMDFDADGHTEWLACNGILSLVLQPSTGGCCRELSHIPTRINAANTMARRRESPPDTLSPNSPPPVPGPADTHPRAWFQDLLVKRHTSAEELESGRYTDLGDFHGGAYETAAHGADSDGWFIRLERAGSFELNSGPQPLKITKTYRLDHGAPGRVRVFYRIEHTGDLPVQGIFMVQSNAALPGREERLGVRLDAQERHARQRWYEGTGSALHLTSADAGLSCRLTASGGAAFWCHPLESPHPGMSGDGTILQGICFSCGWLIGLMPEESVEFALELDVGSVG